MRYLIVSLLGAGLAAAGSINVTESNPITQLVSPDGAAIINVQPLTAISPSSFNATVATAQYPGFQYSIGSSSSGTFNVTRYDAGWYSDTSGGAILQATYNNGGPAPAGQQFRWIQVISTNEPNGGTSSPYIDPRPPDDTLPFYWTNAELPSYSTAKTLSFTDFPRRDSGTLATTSPISWTGDLYLVNYNMNKTVTVHDGLQWGWQMSSATAGKSTGTFLNPSPACPPATCTGVGTNSFSWGQGVGTPPSSLTFKGTNFNPPPNKPFVLGTLNFFNGTITSDSGVNNVELDFSTAFTNNPKANQILKTELALVNTPNTSDPIASADYVYFTSGGFSSSFHVLEGDSASADIMAEIVASTVVGDKSTDVPLPLQDVTYSLELLGFANPTSGGFVVNAVPEPHAAGLMIVGLAALALVRLALLRDRKLSKKLRATLH